MVKNYYQVKFQFLVQNSTLPILAATILANKKKIKNVPLVKDIFTMVKLLKLIGLKINIKKKNNII